MNCVRLAPLGAALTAIVLFGGSILHAEAPVPGPPAPFYYPRVGPAGWSLTPGVYWRSREDDGAPMDTRTTELIAIGAAVSANCVT